MADGEDDKGAAVLGKAAGSEQRKNGTRKNLIKTVEMKKRATEKGKEGRRWGKSKVRKIEKRSK